MISFKGAAKCYVGEDLLLPEWRKKWKKVLTSVNAIGRKEKSATKLALEKENGKAGSSASTNSSGEQSEKTDHIDKDSSPTGSIIV